MGTSVQMFRNTHKNNSHEINRQEIQGAINKSLELRALHAALMEGNIPGSIRCPSSASPSLSRPSRFFPQDYPVFTPSYKDESLPGYHNIPLETQSLSGRLDGYSTEDIEADFSDIKREVSSLQIGVDLGLFKRASKKYSEDKKSVISSCANHITVLQNTPGSDFFKSSRTGFNPDLKSLTNSKKFNTFTPLTDSHSSLHPQSKIRGPILSWLFPRLKKKPKNDTSSNRAESEDVSQIFKDLGIMSLESLKRDLIEANENRDAALMEVTEMKSSLGELKKKLEHLETYCEELKKALKQTVKGKDTEVLDRLSNISRREKSISGHKESLIPVSDEVMVEGFLQIASEVRLSVKHFCKTLIAQIEETDKDLIEKLNLLLQPYKLNLNSKYSKSVLYHLEALINQSLYLDFENCVFQKNGSPKLLDPQQDRQAQFTSFVSLRNLSWNEVLRKGAKYYSEEFSKFCDQKMSCIISSLNWTRPWPEQLLQSFFVTAKCIWLLHLLAFSFNPPLLILRVEENRSFDPAFMEDCFVERQRLQGLTRVKIMVMPGFYVQDRVLKCKVLCRYKSVA